MHKFFPCIFLGFLLNSFSLLAGPYPPAAGIEGSDAIPATDSRILAWAAFIHVIEYGAEVSDNFKTPQFALGPATTDTERDTFHIVSLGDSGTVTLGFSLPIRDGDGPDFAVFENSFNNYFLELAFVEVSSDGIHFLRFSNHSLTPAKVGAFPNAANGVDPTNLSGLAGKHRIGFGTPFDLNLLRTHPDSVLLDFDAVRFVRIVDIIGNGSQLDSFGNPIYDPHPTIGSAGFDLDAVGVLNQAAPVPGTLQIRWEASGYQLYWRGKAGGIYRLEWSPDLQSWASLGELTASDNWSLWPDATKGREGFFRLLLITN